MATLSQQLGELDLGDIAGLIQTSLTTLANAQPTITVNGQSVTLDFQAATGLGPVIEALQQIPTDPAALERAMRDMLGELQNLTAIPELHMAVEVAERLQQIGAMIAEVVAHAGGDPAALIEQLLGESGGLRQIIDDLTGRFLDAMPVQLPDAIKVPVEALQVVATGNVANAAQLADVVARFLIGVDLQKLREPSVAIDGSVDIVLHAGGDLGAIAARFEQLAAQVRAVIPMLRVAQPDVTATLTTLVQIRAGIDALFADLPGAIRNLSTGLDHFDADAVVARITGALQPLLNLVPNLSFDLRESALEPLRALKLQIDALTAEQLDGVFDDIELRFQAAIDSSGIGETLGLIEHYRELAVERLRRIELARFRDEIVRAIAGIEARVNQFAFGAPQLLERQLEEVRAKIAGIDTQKIKDAVQAVKTKIESIVQNLPVGQLLTQVGGAIEAVSGLAAQLVTKLEEIDAKLDGLAAQVDAIDFEAAADEARELMVGIREKVQEVVGSDDVPPAARGALSLAAQGLKQIDLRGEVRAPIFEKLDALDPNLILTPLQPLKDQLDAMLDQVTPSALVAQLDQPFLDAVAVLEQYKPTALLEMLSHEFHRVTDLLDHADPRTLVAPLQSEFTKITDKIREAASPAPLFAPLETVYGQIMAAVDVVDLEKLLGGIVKRVADMPQSIGTSVQAAVDQRAGGVNAVLPGAPAAFKFGDLVRPFAAIVKDVRDFVNGLPQDVIGGALSAVAAPIVLVQELSDPRRGFLARLAAAVDARVALLLPATADSPAAKLMDALSDLQITLQASTHLSADAHVQLGGGVASVQLDARLTLLVEARVDLDEAVERFFARLTPPSFAVELRRAAAALTTFVPPELTSLPANATVQQRVNALFDAIDPAPFVVELDAISDDITAKLGALKQEIVNGIVRILRLVFRSIDGVMPSGMSGHLHAFMTAIRAELAGLDPAPIKVEMQALVDSLINVVNAFSPAAIAARLGVVFDAVKNKVNELDPAALVGDTTVLDAPFTALKALQPSIILQPLVAQAKALEDALKALLDLQLGEALVSAVVRLRAAIEGALDDVFAEFEALLAFLEGGGDVSVSASVSVG